MSSTKDLHRQGCLCSLLLVNIFEGPCYTIKKHIRKGKKEHKDEKEFVFTQITQ